jgi:hypothetical protein
LKRRRFVHYSTKRRFVVFFNPTQLPVSSTQKRIKNVKSSRFSLEKERRPVATASRDFPNDADFSALKPTRPPDVNVRRSKKLRVLATFLESAVPVAYRRRPPRRQNLARKPSISAKTPILTQQAVKKVGARSFLPPLCRDATPRSFGRFVVDRSSQALGASRSNADARLSQSPFRLPCLRRDELEKRVFSPLAPNVFVRRRFAFEKIAFRAERF